jgi:DNA-binding PadR family transcriptional regulator
MELLLRSEEMVLIAILHLQDQAYGVPIRQYLAEVMGTDVAYASVYLQLERLTRKGYVKGTDAPPTKERGGRRKRYYAVTAAGRAALREVDRIHRTLWQGLSPDALGPAYG